PANLARLMAQLPGLIYARRDHDVYVNLFIGSDATVDVAGTPVRIAQQTNYPWDGRVTLTIASERPVDATIALRIPGWSTGATMPSDLYRFATADASKATLLVNGKPSTLAADKGYARIKRRWQRGDTVQLELPMPIRRVLANDGVADDR